METANLGSCNTAPGTGDWEDYEVAIELTEFLTTINNPEYTRLRLHFSTGASPGTQKSTYTPADITQVYVVLTYDDGETTTAPLYLRENGTWTAVEGTVYQKVDGAWVESGADVFQEGDAYGLVTL